MNERRPAPIGPLALVLRHVHSTFGGRRLAILAAALGAILLIGIVVLFLR